MLFCVAAFSAPAVSAGLTLQDLDYGDSLDSLANPECGFYDAKVLRLLPSGKLPDNAERWHSWGNLFQMRIDISRFSDNGCFAIKSDCEEIRPLTDECKAQAAQSECKSQPFTDEALALLEEYFKEARAENRSLIVRLAYDSWYDGHSNAEPDQSTILAHLKQVGPLYSKYSDVIVFVELGLYGRWGEMNGSLLGTNEAIAEAMQTLLQSTSSEIKTGPRRPDIVAAWMGLQTKNEKGWTSFTDFVVDSSKFIAMTKAKGDTLYRVGMFNDGYLGNDGDMGTIGYGDPGKMTREMMVRWLQEYGAKYTPYGGELVHNSNDAGRPAINSPRYLSYEGFRTHTSYLNRYHHKATIDAWVDSTFDGKHDSEYVGKNGFVYVRNHLGYRYILRESLLADSAEAGGTFNAKLKIENVGFGNMTQKRTATLVLRRKGGAGVRELPLASTFDPQTLTSRPVYIEGGDTTYGTGLHDVDVFATIPADMEPGEYDAYLRISKYGDLGSDGNFQTVRFGNPAAQYDSVTGANSIGKFFISKKTTALRNGGKAPENSGRHAIPTPAVKPKFFDLLGRRNVNFR